MADGTTEPIQSINPGEVVLSYDTASGRLYPDVVVANVNLSAHGEYVINGVLHTDYKELFYTKRGWIASDHLKVGDEIFKPVTGTWSPITNITYDANAYFTVYDLVYASGNTQLVGSGYLSDITVQ